MDIAWLILDSLSFSATPFSPHGKNTMPKLANLAKDSGVIYNNAYVPGPTSPSSHGSFFTGEPPSVTGMHEAFPHFESNIPTIAEVLSDSHRSLLISANPYIFNGLDRGFDVTNDLRSEEYMIFSGARDPANFPTSEYENRLYRYLKYVTTSSKPIRSLVNGVQYRRVMKKRRSSLPETSGRDQHKFQYANEMNARIRDFLAGSNKDTFVVANYMDIHPPLDASDDALERFCSGLSTADIPIGVRGQDVYEQLINGDNEIAENMTALLHATIWDTDKKIAPLVELLLQQNTLVVITADHGTWYQRETELDEDRIHVPLIVFSPDEEPRTVDHTVNLQSLPRTTLNKINHSEADQLPGRDLLRVTKDAISITEFIYTSNESGVPVNPTGDSLDKIHFDMAAVRGEDRIDYIDEDFVIRRGNNHGELSEKIEERLSNAPVSSQREIQYDEEVKQRLKDFGYL